MKQAVVLAAGEGVRLRPFTVTKPKSMLFIAGKPIIQYVLESLSRTGIRNIILIAGYRKEQVFDYIGSGEKLGVDVNYITQHRQLGTAHALAQARGTTDDEFLVLPGDKLIAPETLSRMVKAKPQAMLIKKEDNPSRYSVMLTEKGKLKNILDKPKQPETSLINTGIYAFNKDIFAYIDSALDIPDVLKNMLADKYPITAIETDNLWMNVVYPWDILNLNDAILHQIPPSQNGTIESGVFLKGPVAIGKDTVIKPNSFISGPVVIGDGCEIGPNVCILPATSIGDNVVLSPFTEISNCVISDDVHVGSGSIIQDSVIDKGCVIGAHFTACSDEAEVKVDIEHHSVKIGAMLGENCNIGSCVNAQSGVVVGNDSQVKSLKLITGRFPDKSVVV